MASVAELDLTALFELERIVLLDRRRKHIHHLDVVVDRDNNVESAWMERNRLWLISDWAQL